MAVGNDADFDGFAINWGNPGGTALVVGNDAQLNNGSIYGDFVYGVSATVSDTVRLDAGGTESMGSPIDFAAEEANLQTGSANLGALPANGTSIVEAWYTIDLIGTNPTLNVFDLTGDDLTSAVDLYIEAPAGSTVVVNISGASADLSDFGTTLVGIDQSDVLYNFVEATALNINSISVEGTILAPYADATFTSANIDGQIIVYNLTGDGEPHYIPFDGTVDECPEEEIPEGSCTVSYEVTNDWTSGSATGFQASVDVTWSGDVITEWELEWAFSGDESIDTLWNGYHTQTGADVSVEDGGWNGTVYDGETVHIGFLGEYTTTSGDPTDFYMNGILCNDEGGDTGGDTGGEDTGPVFE